MFLIFEEKLILFLILKKTKGFHRLLTEKSLSNWGFRQGCLSSALTAPRIWIFLVSSWLLPFASTSGPNLAAKSFLGCYFLTHIHSERMALSLQAQLKSWDCNETSSCLNFFLWQRIEYADCLTAEPLLLELQGNLCPLNLKKIVNWERSGVKWWIFLLLLHLCRQYV